MDVEASGTEPDDRARTGGAQPTSADTGGVDTGGVDTGGADTGGADASQDTASTTSLPTDRNPSRPLDPGSVGTATSSLFAAIALYSVLRLGLWIALTAVLMLFMPLIVALMFAIIMQLPLSWLLFSGPRRRVNEAIALASQQRRAERARLQAALTGDDGIE